MLDVLCRRPPDKGCDLEIRVTSDKENDSLRVAQLLHGFYDAECQDNARLREIFMPNKMYEFSNGIAFRYCVDEVESTNQRIEFVASPLEMRTIPSMLERSGITDRAVIGKITNFIDRLLTPPAENVAL